MRIEIKGKHLELTDAIRQYATSKAEKLPKYYDGVQEIVVTLDKPLHNHAYEVEFIADVEKHADFVAKATGEDLYGCIDQCAEKMTRQLADFKERLKNSKR